MLLAEEVGVGLGEGWARCLGSWHGTAGQPSAVEVKSICYFFAYRLNKTDSTKSNSAEAWLHLIFILRTAVYCLYFIPETSYIYTQCGVLSIHSLKLS